MKPAAIKDKILRLARESQAPYDKVQMLFLLERGVARLVTKRKL